MFPFHRVQNVQRASLLSTKEMGATQGVSVGRRTQFGDILLDLN